MNPLTLTALLALGNVSLPLTADAKHQVELGGRVMLFADAEAINFGPTQGSLALSSVRAEVAYRWEDWLKILVELEAEGRPELKDAYVRVRWGGFGVKAGHFKPPSSAIFLESRWSIPMTRRGVLDEALFDTVQLAGRRPGLQLEWKGEGNLKPSAQLGVFQGSDHERDLLPPGPLASLNVAARGTLELGKVELGAFAELRASEPLPSAELSSLFAGGLDAVYDCKFTGQALRLWADAILGQSAIDDDLSDGRSALFLAARGIAAWRWGGLEESERYLEPYVSLGLFDPNARIQADLVFESAVGLNLGYWRHARLTLEVAHARGSRNTPALFETTRTHVSAMLGGAF
jgi:hypothetical protein